jgi:hypothetical protein
VSASYAAAARDVGAILLPAGDAWREAWTRDPNLALYSDDGLHPSAEGSYLAALVIYQRLTGRTPVGLPSKVGRVSIDPAHARLLQEAAAASNARLLTASGLAASR